ncbi:DUF4884 domain-containing protein [Dysgonomonas sp. Marseille-P4677]|uniref:DUF4884 domain-containing protein n=1 Tax=Dysgonomonas sp. Marseille-P4677 TaxID=2364790 RepID=UPI00191468C7|nr:DUF4884 domain-containing protein [Dysgonomonas sp. Marseille-P4677]MBK5720055.1 DUF4884 domain-containing protein [Dysgonomonas sp. Marseille-P4677]
MKILVNLLLGSLSVIGLFSCSVERPIVSQISDNNQTYKVDYLFEHDGCKVYRFMDRGKYVYFTNCTGDVTAIANDSTKVRTQTLNKRSTPK